MILLIIASIGRTQNYPVQAFVQLTPPYSSYLPDYSDPFNNQLKVLLTLTDFSIPSYQVKLRFKIEGQGYTIESADLINFSTITLSPGVPVEISGSSLAPYLATNNLVFSGIDVASYEQNKLLPEGPATICVEVIDALGSNQSVIGNPSCAQSWFFKHDPPLLNTPFCGTEITPTDPQMVLFSWTPLHMSSPNAGQTQYKFELFEVQNEGDDPNLVVNSPPFAMSTQITTNNFINYGIADNALVVGKTYVWRVQAMDPSGRDLYNNQGFSQVCTFTYGNVAASLLDGVTLELETFGTGVRQGTANWNASGTFDSYVLEVRKTGNSAYEWFPHEVLTGQKKVNSLDPETEYEARVKGIANGAETDWSNISTFTTLPEPEYECGDASQPGQSPQFVPLDFLLPSHIVDIGQFSMTVTSAEPSGTAPGHFKGYGRVFIPFIFSNVNVGFDDITVDDNMKMVNGKVEALTQGVDQWVNNNSQSDYSVPEEIDSSSTNYQDSIVVIYFGDSSLDIPFPSSGDSTMVTDSEGNVYTIHDDGSVTVVLVITIELSSFEIGILDSAFTKLLNYTNQDTINYLANQRDSNYSLLTASKPSPSLNLSMDNPALLFISDAESINSSSITQTDSLFHQFDQQAFIFAATNSEASRLIDSKKYEKIVQGVFNSGTDIQGIIAQMSLDSIPNDEISTEIFDILRNHMFDSLKDYLKLSN